MTKVVQKPVNAGAKLTKYVGVVEVCSALGISRSTLTRERRDKAFPEATKLRGRVVWPVEAVQAYADERAAIHKRELAMHAKTDPDDLTDEQLGDLATDLAARHLSQRIGTTVSAADVVIARRREATVDEVEAMVDGVGRAFEGVPYPLAIYIAGWVVPAMRPGLETALQKHGHTVPRTPEEWKRAGLAAWVKSNGGP